MTTEQAGLRVVGNRARIKRWDERTAGADSYAADLDLPGVLTAKVLRSPHPLARIRSVDTTAARAMPGVRAVITAADLPPGARYIHQGGKHADRPPLAIGLARYVGEEIAAVAAETEEQASAAVAAIRVRYRVLRAPVDIDRALGRGAHHLHDRGTGQRNVSVHESGAWGDPAAGRAASVISVSGSFSYPRVAHACMEPNTTLAWWHAGSGTLELWTSTQAPWFVQRELSHVFRMAFDKVICRDVAVGGGFGAKSKICEHEVLAAALSMASGHPVLLALTREEEFAATKPRHAFRVDLTTHADAGGRIRALGARIDVDNGAYNHFGPSVMKVGIKTLGSIYQPDGLSWDARLVDTALPPGGQFRGYGSPQTTLALEVQVDEVAEALGLDPIDIRVRNASQPGSVALCGARIGSARLAECLTAVRDAIGWADKRQNRTPYRGVGVACGMHGSGSYAYDNANRSAAAVDLFADGHALVRFGGADAGTGQRTVLAQIAAEELGLGLDAVEVLMADGERTPFDMGAWSSRGTHMGGHAARAAAAGLAAHLRELAADKLGSGDVRLAAGRATASTGEIQFGDLVGLSPRSRDGVLSHEATYVEERMERFGAGGTGNFAASYTFAAHAVEVEVDPATGLIRVLDYVAAHDVGRAINPTMVEGQICGGVVQGLGAALGEELRYEQGRAVNPSYLDYALPRAGDVPAIRTMLIGGPEQAGPYDAKSTGEMPIVLPGPAIVNAVYDAIGIRIRDLPLTPDKVLAALAARGGHHRRHGIWRRPGRWWIAAMRRAYPLGIHHLLHRHGTRWARHVPGRAVAAVEQPDSLAEVQQHRRAGGTPLGGGTDLFPQRSARRAAPAVLVSLGHAEELRTIRRDSSGGLWVGAAVTLADLAREMRSPAPAVTEAIETIASAQIRAAATVAGNLVQAKRCWFFRNGFDCYKRGGPACPCYAVLGDHRFYHAAIGGHRCQAVTPSDLATVFTALDADVVIVDGSDRSRTVHIERFYRGPGETVLGPQDTVTAIHFPAAALARRTAFEKLRLWDGDFAVTSAAVSAATGPGGEWLQARIVLGALAPTPWRARRTERAMGCRAFGKQSFQSLINRELDASAHPLPGNRWKLDAAAGLAVRVAERVSHG